MFLPVHNKPNSSSDYLGAIIEVPNLITRDVADKLKNFALDTQVSGWHRRGSKTNYVKASFYTCLVFEHNVSIYNVLDNAWERYLREKDSNITFIEPYEIKAYNVNDSFGVHNDILVSDIDNVERKLNLIVQLSDENDYEGGDLYVGSMKCARKFGTGIFFPAKYIHCVTEVTNGTRFSLIGHAWGPISK